MKADKLFHRAKVVDPDIDLMYDEKDGSICKFVITSYNLWANLDTSTWWNQAHKWVPLNICWLHNDKSMAEMGLFR